MSTGRSLSSRMFIDISNITLVTSMLLYISAICLVIYWVPLGGSQSSWALLRAFNSTQVKLEVLPIASTHISRNPKPQALSVISLSRRFLLSQ